MPRALPKRERSAYHEAGHVVIAEALHIPVRLVTIKPEGKALGDTEFAPLRELCNSAKTKPIYKRRWLERYAIFALAGTASECRRLEEYNEISDSNREAFRNRWLPKLWKENSDDDESIDSLMRSVLAVQPFPHAQVMSGAEEDRERSVYRSLLWGWTCNLLANWLTWKNVETVAGKLLEVETISGRQVRQILRPYPESRRDRGFLS